ncbi:hypothetical protein Anapl_08652 [Anas platyrhynchos]|uniref:Uncharacterized protein n=1 Tax=Anas platyrhynchos TaxID=8839 RepID=R0KZB2_ANAPL|nr:hypothetical protein Anapl_08652 [Anas platyrhynchos]
MVVINQGQHHTAIAVLVLVLVYWYIQVRLQLNQKPLHRALRAPPDLKGPDQRPQQGLRPQWGQPQLPQPGLAMGPAELGPVTAPLAGLALARPQPHPVLFDSQEPGFVYGNPAASRLYLKLSRYNARAMKSVCIASDIWLTGTWRNGIQSECCSYRSIIFIKRLKHMKYLLVRQYQEYPSSIVLHQPNPSTCWLIKCDLNQLDLSSALNAQNPFELTSSRSGTQRN